MRLFFNRLFAFCLIQSEADENRLVQIVRGGDTIIYAYDPLGRRIAKSVNNVVTWYVYDGNAILAAYDSSGTITARYAHGLNIDEPLAVQQGSTKSFYHADGLGSIVALTNAAGSVVQTYSYDSFGNITQSGGITQPYTYTAREYDNETGMYFYRARYYDPKAGRFITKDPISFAGGDVNLYGVRLGDVLKNINSASFTYQLIILSMTPLSYFREVCQFVDYRKKCLLKCTYHSSVELSAIRIEDYEKN
ncbi:MAG: RHS repeat-associated core domain-containing protein [Syntrophaceae bacterium]